MKKITESIYSIYTGKWWICLYKCPPNPHKAKQKRASGCLRTEAVVLAWISAFSKHSHVTALCYYSGELTLPVTQSRAVRLPNGVFQCNYVIKYLPTPHAPWKSWLSPHNETKFPPLTKSFTSITTNSHGQTDTQSKYPVLFIIQFRLSPSSTSDP